MPSTLDQYAVIGNPIAHSKSPQIHTLFANQTQQALHYDKVFAPLDAFKATVLAFKAQHGKGCNVTVPFKQEAWALATNRTHYAESAGAVNTLIFGAEGSILGHNTDGIGLVRDITNNLSTSLTDKRILLLGAGGAVRGVLQPLLEQSPSEVVVANRTVTKAHELVQLFASYGLIKAASFNDLEGAFDIVINGTSASLHGELPPIPSVCIQPSTFCYDMMYGAEPTLFMQWASTQGSQYVHDGLGMLVEQAAEAFKLWRGVLPNTQSVLTQLRKELK